ncbi:hypothetical protein F5Y16DRAFT_367108 [Xylariaceae sp. FL0255]|nr:hypothetical protein F5Y16DRAFT_367108 [Xylariaceae sp. FL0255]
MHVRIVRLAFYHLGHITSCLLWPCLVLYFFPFSFRWSLFLWIGYLAARKHSDKGCNSLFFSSFGFKGVQSEIYCKAILPCQHITHNLGGWHSCYGGKEMRRQLSRCLAGLRSVPASFNLCCVDSCTSEGSHTALALEARNMVNVQSGPQAFGIAGCETLRVRAFIAFPSVHR